MKLKRITFTGADDHTDIAWMLDISKNYPYVEWGILLPSSGGSRFPSRSWLIDLIGAATLSSFSVNLSGHLCPPLTDAYLKGALSIETVVGDAFQRIQINTHGCSYLWHDMWKDIIEQDDKREYIIQLDSPLNIRRMLSAQQSLRNVTGLFDMSHGAGVLPKSWPRSSAPWVGYAGGLGPHNLEKELGQIDRIVPAGNSYWVDMETHVRTDGRFDLKKCLQCLEIAKSWIEETPIVNKKIQGGKKKD